MSNCLLRAMRWEASARVEGDSDSPKKVTRCRISRGKLHVRRNEGSETHRLHRPTTPLTFWHLKLLIPHSLPELNVSIWVQLLLPLSSHHLVQISRPFRVQLTQSVLEGVATDWSVAGETVGVSEGAV